MSDSRRLFTPLKIGSATVQNRIALAPLTRFRADNHVPQPKMAVYYGQRADHNLLITEATFIHQEAGGYKHVPGIETKEQIEGWKQVTKAVHDKGAIIYLQLWAIGRANGGDQDVPKVVSASNLPFEGGATPEPLSKDDIKRYVGHYRQAALNAIEAGFDGVEIHSANGYLPHQFIEEHGSNNRTDEYGGSVENRLRFPKEIIDAVTEAVGEERTGIRLSPFGPFQGMGKEPLSTFVTLCEYIKTAHPKFAYVHLVEDSGAWIGKEIKEPRSADPFRRVFRQPTGTTSEDGESFPEPTPESPTVIVSCGDYHTDTAIKHCEAKGDVIAIGRNYISNPDLVERIRKDLKWTPYNRDTFYLPLSDTGYTDYAVYGERGHGEEAAEKKEQEAAKKEKANM